MNDLPPGLKVRALKQVEFKTSVHNWLQVADILEEHAEKARGLTTRKPGWEFGQQMADQIRIGCSEVLGEE